MVVKSLGTLVLILAVGEWVTTPASAASTTSPSSKSTTSQSNAAETSTDKPKMIAHIDTSMGRISVELMVAKAPRLVAHFVDLVKKGAYKGSQVYRGIPKYLVEFGKVGDDCVGDYYIRDDMVSTLSHTNPGMVSFVSPFPNTGGRCFLINLVKAPHLDGKHPRFGRVIAGMEILEGMAQHIAADGSAPVTIQDISVEGKLPPRIRVETLPLITNERAASLSKKDMESLANAIGESRGIGKLLTAKYLDMTHRGHRIQVRYALEFPQKKFGEMIALGDATDGSFELKQFQFRLTNSLPE